MFPDMEGNNGRHCTKLSLLFTNSLYTHESLPLSYILKSAQKIDFDNSKVEGCEFKTFKFSHGEIRMIEGRVRYINLNPISPLILNWLALWLSLCDSTATRYLRSACSSVILCKDSMFTDTRLSEIPKF